MTDIRTQERLLYLVVLLDLFSQLSISWEIKSHITADLTVDALLMTVWRHKPKQPVLVHSDQDSKFAEGEWQDFLKVNNLSCNMNRRSNYLDNTVAGRY